MEHSLTHIVQEFEREREILASMTRTELDDMRSVASVLRENLRKKTSEMKYIRRLAFHIIRQRTDLERFFMDALEYVRMELKMEAERKKKERIEAIFINRDHDGGGATRTGGTSSKPLTAESTDVDVRELGWQDKERILRLLFAKMNGVIPDNTAEAMPANQQSALAKEEETIVEAMFAPSISEEQVDAATRKHQVLTREALAAHTQ